MMEPTAPEPPDPAETERLHDLIQAYGEAMRAGRADELEALSQELMARMADRIEANPSPEVLLKAEAVGSEIAGDWGRAEAAYRRLAVLADEAREPLQQSRDRNELAQFLRLLGRDAEALEVAKAAADFARQSDLRPLIAMTLESVAGCALTLERVEEARQAVQETLHCLGDDPLFSMPRARALVYRAFCAMKAGDVATAEEDLDTAWQLFEPYSGLPGGQSGLALWWGCTARVRARTGDREEAVAAAKEAVERWRQLTELPQAEGVRVRNALARALHLYGEVLLDAGQPYPAEEAFTEGREIREALGLPPFVEK